MGQKKSKRASAGCVIERGEYQYQARIAVAGQLRTKTFESADQAREWLNAISSAPRNQLEIIAAGREMTLAQAMQRRLAIKEEQLKSWRDQQNATKRLIRDFKWLGQLKIFAVNELHILQFMDERIAQGVCNTSVNNDLAIISNTFNVARTKMGCVGLVNPIQENTRLPREKGRDHRLEGTEEALLLRLAADYEQGSDVRIASVIRFAIGTAMRFGEIARMTWEDVDLNKSVVRLRDTKNGEDRSVPLSGAMNLLLRNLGPRNTGLVWGTAHAIRSAWRRTRDNAVAFARNSGQEALALKLTDLRFHDFRHEATSRLFEESDLSMMEIAAITGHKGFTMLQHYTHLRAHRLVRKLGPMPEALQLDGIDHPDSKLVPAAEPDWKKAERRGQWKMLSSSAALLRAAVSSMPISELARSLGISDVAIHKACARLNVEKPPRGFWLRSSSVA